MIISLSSAHLELSGLNEEQDKLLRELLYLPPPRGLGLVGVRGPDRVSRAALGPVVSVSAGSASVTWASYFLSCSALSGSQEARWASWALHSRRGS